LTIVISNLTLNWFFALLSNTSFPTCPERSGLELLVVPIVTTVGVAAAAPGFILPTIAVVKSLGIGGSTFDLFDTGE